MLKFINSTIIIFFLTSCQSYSIKNYTTKVIIPKTINLTQNDFEKHIIKRKVNKINYKIEITIYYLSTGKETFQMSNIENLTFEKDKYKIKALVKIKKNNKLIKSFFTKQKGNSKNETIKLLMKSIDKKLII